MGPVIETLVTALAGHTAAFTGESRRDQAASQELVAACRAQFRGLRAGLYEISGQIDTAVGNGDDVTPELRAEAYAASMFTVDTARRMASDIFAGGTRDAFVRDDPMERGLKDLHAIGYIMAAARFIVQDEGKHTLEVIQKIVVLFEVQRQDDFAIGFGGELIGSFQGLAQRLVIVNFTIDCE